MKTIKVKKLHKDAVIPSYHSLHAAGADLVSIEDTCIIWPGEIKVFKTGLAFEIPVGYEVQIRPRSGLAIKDGISVVNSPGTIDADYRGEILVGLINTSNSRHRTIFKGSRIAQAVLKEIPKAEWVEVKELNSTGRGEDGLGSTGS